MPARPGVCARGKARNHQQGPEARISPFRGAPALRLAGWQARAGEEPPRRVVGCRSAGADFVSLEKKNNRARNNSTIK